MTLTKFIRMGAVAAGALAVATQVNAADIYAGGGLKDAPVYVAGPVWTGFYIGVHAGGAWANMQTTDIDGSWWANGSQWNNISTGIIGGGQVGYNYQTGSFVFGVEADFGGLGLSHRQVFDSWDYTQVNDGFYADVTGRLGYAVGPALFYAKGGWAYYGGSVSVHDTFNYNTLAWGFGPNGSVVSSSGLSGFTIGGGVEYKVSPNWSVKGEYRFFDFGSATGNLYPTAWWGGDSRFKRELTADAVTLGINYYFGGAVYAPLK